MGKNKVNRKVDRYVILSIYDFNGDIIEKLKSNVLNRGLGVIMVMRLMDNFNINLEDIRLKQKSLIDEELKLQNELLS